MLKWCNMLVSKYLVILKVAETNTYNSFAICFFSLFSYFLYANCKIDNDDKKKQL